MYEKIINYFETNLCMENIYFRKNYKKWIIGLISTLVFELVSNYVLLILISNIWERSIIILLFDFIFTILFLVFIYVILLKKYTKSMLLLKQKSIG